MKAGGKSNLWRLDSKQFVNFNKFHYLKLLHPKIGKPEYICICTEMSLKKKRNLISTCLYLKFIYCLVIDLTD